MSDLAVIIPHYNDTARLTRCLEALEPQDRTGVEVVVADNASTQDLNTIQTRFDWVRFTTQPEPGAGPARNAGVAASTAPWIAFLDADCLPEATWLAQTKRAAAGDPKRMTGGRVKVFDETPAPRSGAEAFETVFAFDQESYVRDKGFSVTANLIVPRTAYEATGPFRTGVSEDVEWCHRARAAGYGLEYDPNLAVGHPSRSDWAALAKKWRRLTTEEYGLGGSRLSWAIKALLLPASALAHMPKVLRHTALSPLEKRRAMGTLARIRTARMVWIIRALLSPRAGMH